MPQATTTKKRQLPKAGIGATRDCGVMDIQLRVIDESARTVELAFSSEAPVDRWWGTEILDHSPKSVDLSRFKRGGALLMDHNRTDQVGVIESARIDGDRVGRAVVRFGKGVRASEVFQDVVDGIRTNVSVGYTNDEVVLESEKDGNATYRIKKWTPMEISLVSIPADISVGVGREAEDEPESASATPVAPVPQSETTGARAMPEANDTATVVATPAVPAAAVDHTAIRAEAQTAGINAERERIRQITGIGEAFRQHGVDKHVSEAITSGMSVDAFRAKAMEVMSTAATPTAEIGMTEREKQRFSFVRALNYLANPNDPQARAAASFEIECSNAAIKHTGKQARGLLVPFDVLSRNMPMQRGLTVGTPTAGGNLVGTTFKSSSFIELLRDAMVIDKMGASFLTGLSGKIAIPRQSGGATGYWLAENGAPPSNSQQTFDQVPLSGKTVGAYTEISRQLLVQESIDVESLVMNDIATQIGLTIQSAALFGGSSNQPVGVASTAGIGSVAGGTNGAAPTWANIVALETAVAVANAAVGSLGYITNAKVRGTLKNTFKPGATTGIPLWGDGAEPLNGYKAAITNGVPSNLTKGTSSGVCSAILFGNWADLIIGMWSGVDLLVNPYSLDTTGAVRVTAFQDVDVAVRHTGSFAAMLDALTP